MPPRSIQVLPEPVIHKIAAGEVVERPVSVVKELVENALDAGATHIAVEISEGGLKSIIVTDNGHGIPPQELATALKRHATSKITRAEDLFSLSTLGFRGEALPSIASVSRFRIESATVKSAPLGYVLEMEGGRLSGLMETPLTEGTRVVVKELFCTTPARLKFLKRPETEWGHCYDLLVAFALSHLGVEWSLTHNGKKSLSCPAVSDPKRRILDLFGKEVMDILYPVERKVSGLSLAGLIGHPNYSKKTNRDLHVFVNGRVVHDRLIQHAILTGYRGLLMTQQYPTAVLHLRVDPQGVDVNVHPTKREVRFANSQVIHHLISETIRHALESAPWRENAILGGSNPAVETLHATSLQMVKTPTAVNNHIGGFEIQPALDTLYRPLAVIGTLPFSRLNLIGQFDRTYLVCSHDGSLILIDQHAAHERIGFEQLKKSFQGALPRQNLLHPFTFDLSESEAQRLREVLAELEKFGFVLEEFGDKTFLLKAHPTLLKGCDWVKVLKEVGSELEEGRLHPLENKVDHILATMACHRQVRAGDSLNREEMLHLLKQLEGTPRSYHCPHGRPVMVEIASAEIEKWFKRAL